MRLTAFTDYALRILIYADAAQGELVTISQVSETYNISRGHVIKIVQLLTSAGYLETFRGRTGGFRLGCDAKAIKLGDLVRLTEPDFRLVECFGTPNTCLISKYCKAPEPLNAALNAFLTTLDGYTLESLRLPAEVFERTGQTNFPARGPDL